MAFNTYDDQYWNDDQSTTYPTPVVTPPVAPPSTTPEGGGGGFFPNFGGIVDTVKANAGGGGGGAGGGGGSPLSARPRFNFGPVPEFVAPKFQGPTLQDALNEPGYQFRLGAGQDALERSAAARGVLRTGGTLKDLIEYGQNFAAQEYGNVFNRALQSFDRDYRGAYDAYAPRLAEWQNKARAEQLGALAGFDREWQQYVFNNTPRGGGGGGGSDLAELLNALDVLGPSPTGPAPSSGQYF